VDELGYGVGGGSIAGVLTAILAVLVREKIQSKPSDSPGEAVAAINDLTQRVIRLEVQLEAVRETTDDLRQLNRDLQALLRDISKSSSLRD
jgi:hypothetical protein